MSPRMLPLRCWLFLPVRLRMSPRGRLLPLHRRLLLIRLPPLIAILLILLLAIRLLSLVARFWCWRSVCCRWFASFCCWRFIWFC